MRKAVLLLLVAMIAVNLAACNDGGNDFFNVQAITVSPEEATLRQGETQQLIAIASIFASGSQDATTSVTWLSSNPAVASVSDSGVVTAGTAGNATITATLNGREDDAQITVISVQTGLLVTPNNRLVDVGTSLQLQASGLFDNGTDSDVTNAVTWTSASNSIATVDATGLVRGVAVGQTTINATSENGLVASVTVNVFQSNTFTSTGSTAAEVLGTVDAFRATLGTLNPNTNESFPNGRREINWDGVLAPNLNTDAFPSNFFNLNSPRGVIFTSTGTGFRVSDNGFGDINPTYPSQFVPFSGTKIFSVIGANAFDTQFFLPGSDTPAFSNGFGAVFCDPDNAVSTLTFVLSDGSTFERTVPDIPGSGGFGFLGVAFTGASASRVTLLTGQAALAGANNDITNGGVNDMVVVDDFIYGEPQPTP